MSIELKKLSITEVIKGVKTGTMQLPEFQRDYVWSQKNQKALLESILNGYPIGSILLLELEAEEQMFAWNHLNNLPPNDNKRLYVNRNNRDSKPPQYLILDGQQRITTVSKAVLNINEGEYPKSLYFKTEEAFESWRKTKPKGQDITDWLEEQSFDKLILIGKYNDTPQASFRQRSHNVSFTVLFDKSAFETEKNEIMNEISEKINVSQNSLTENKSSWTSDRIAKKEAEIKNLKEWREFFTYALGRIFDNYFEASVPAVIIPKDMSIQGVCKVFETTNTTGMKLGAFDLCVATLYPKDVKLKSLFDEAMKSYPLLNIYDGESRRYILQYIALKNILNPKTAGLPKILKKEHFDDWNDSIKEVNNAIETLDSYCGSSVKNGNTKNLIYEPLIPSIAVVIKAFPINDSVPSEKNKRRIQKLRCWYYSSGISRRYGEGSDNKQLRDIEKSSEGNKGDDSMFLWFKNNENEIFSKNADVPNWINEPKYSDLNTPGSGATAKTILSLICESEPKDFWDDTIVGNKSGCDIHHIFPINALRKKIMNDENLSLDKANEQLKKLKVDSKLNLTFLKSGTNRQQVSDKLPSIYFKEILNTANSESEKNAIKESFKKHLIDENCLRNLLSDNFIGFIKAREKYIRQKLDSFNVREFSEQDLEQ